MLELSYLETKQREVELQKGRSFMKLSTKKVILPTFLCIIKTVLSIEDPAVGMVIQMAYGKKGVG